MGSCLLTMFSTLMIFLYMLIVIDVVLRQKLFYNYCGFDGSLIGNLDISGFGGLIKDMVVPTRPYASLINNICSLCREIRMLCSLIPYAEGTLALFGSRNWMLHFLMSLKSSLLVLFPSLVLS